jgi:hypothetical protein
MGLPVHCATFPGLSRLNTRAVQSLASHSAGVSTDPVLASTDILALTETWTDNDETVPVDGYMCITQFKR